MAAPSAGAFEGIDAEPDAFWGFTRPQLVALGLMLAFIVAAPFFLYPVFLMKVLCFALFACAFNLLIGYVGLLSFGHAAYFGMGGYLAGHAAKVWGCTPEVSIIIGGLAGMLLGWLIGMLAIRRQGIYFAMITLAMAQMVYFFCVQAPFTNGEDGIQAIPRGAFVGQFSLARDFNLYWLVAGIFVVSFLFIHRVIHSPFGQVMKAIRENEAISKNVATTPSVTGR